MRFTTLLLLTATLFLISGCGSGANRQLAADEQTVKPNTQVETKAGKVDAESLQLRTANTQSLAKQPAETTQANVSLTQADAANAASQAIERKIIRDANLTIEVASPTESQRKIFSVAESH